MPKFSVEVLRVGYSSKSIEVEAKSADDAARIAENTAGNYEFSEKSAVYETQAVRPAKPGKRKQT